MIAFLGFAYDITERKLADIKQQQLTEELIKASRLKDEFMAMMSHELRTPLNAILGMTEILQEGIYGEMNLQQGDALNTIESSGQHLLNIINDILDVAKIESEKLELNLQNVAVAPLCESSLALVEAQARKKSIQLRMSLPFQVPRIHVDEGRMRQVLLNLLNNAVKFTPDHGQVTLEVGQFKLEVQHLLKAACSNGSITRSMRGYRAWCGWGIGVPDGGNRRESL